MYAIIATGGKQYKVAEGDVIKVEKLGVEAGDEVICQSFTFCASANPVTYLGAVPVFVDSEEDTWNMDPALLEEAIKDRIEKTGKKPKAIVPVHLYGMPAKICLLYTSPSPRDCS